MVIILVVAFIVLFYINYPITLLQELCLNTFYSSVIPVKIYANADTIKQQIVAENRKKAGIYRWTNTITGDFYIGSSVSLGRRISEYFSSLLFI